MTGRIRLRDYFGRFHSNSIFFRNLALILLMVAVPLVALSLFTFRYSRILLEKEVSKANSRSLLKFQASMDMIQDEAARITAHMVNNDSVIRFINGDLDAYPDYRQIETMQSIIHDMKLQIHNYINSIYVYSDRNNYLLTPFGGGNLSKWKSLSAHNRLSMPVNEWYFDYQYDHAAGYDSNPSLYLTYYKGISRGENNQRKGIIAVLLDIEKLRTFLFGQETEQGEIMFVTDRDGMILFSTELSWLNRPISDVFTGQTENLFDSRENRELRYGDSSYVFAHIPSEKNDWNYCAILSRQDYYAKNTRLKNIMVISLLFSLSVSVAAAFLVSLYVFKPIHEVIDMLEHPADLDGYSREDNELKFIAGNIMHSYGEYLTNREEIQKRAVLLNTARVRALQAQINPHFLNNTLQLVNWTIMKETGNEDSEAIEILENLADLVRVNMETKNNITTLREEAGYAARYMAIQEKRYGSKIRYAAEIPDALLDRPVLKMMLQPLVENAIYHGLKKSSRAGIITLKASESGRFLKIDVEDNGVGMDSSEMGDLNRSLADADSLTDNHIGLTNVALRMRLVFGKDAALTLYPGAHNGIGVSATIPLPPES